MEERTMTFKLSDGLEYTKAGDKETTHEITLGAPSVSALGACTRFSQSVTRALLQAQKLLGVEDAAEAAKILREREGGAPSADGDDTLDAAALKVMLFASEEDLGLTFEAFKTVALKVGEVDDGLALKAAHIDKMGYEDVLRMMCEYAANFIVPSLFAAEGDGS